MCYSPEVSFGVWIAGIIASIYLYQKGKPFLFPLVVSQMQLVEGLRWINAFNEQPLAILGKIVLYAQPIAALYEAKQYSFLLPYLITLLLVEWLFGSRDLRFVMAEDGHFSWKWIKSPFSIETVPYWIGLVVGASYLLPPEMSLLMFGLLGYFYVHHNKYNTYGSLWCVWVNILWIYYLLR